MLKKGILLLILTVFFAVFSVSVLGDVNIINLSNGDVAFNTTSGYDLKACATSDGGEVLVELEADPDILDFNSNISLYYYKVDSGNNFVINKKSLKNVSNETISSQFALACNGNNAFIVYYSHNGSYFPANETNYTGYYALNQIYLNSIGDIVFSNRTEKSYITFGLDLVVNDYVQAIVGRADQTLDIFDVNANYNDSKYKIDYLKFNKTTGSLLDEKTIFSGFLNQPSIVGNTSNDIHMVYVNFTDFPATNTSEIYYTQLDANGNVIVNPTKLNENIPFLLSDDNFKYSDLVLDSSGQIHAFWLENSSGIFQVRYAKLYSNGTVSLTKDLTTRSRNPIYDFTIFAEMRNNYIDLYYGIMESTTWLSGGESTEYNIYWLNVSTGGTVYNNMTVLVLNYVLFDLGGICTGSAGLPEEGYPPANCCTCCTSDFTCTNEVSGGPPIPEFSPIGIIVAVTIVLVGISIILNKFKR